MPSLIINEFVSFKSLGMHKTESAHSGSREIMVVFERPARHQLRLRRWQAGRYCSGIAGDTDQGV